jgi:hypothetical protein
MQLELFSSEKKIMSLMLKKTSTAIMQKLGRLSPLLAAELEQYLVSRYSLETTVPPGSSSINDLEH